MLIVLGLILLISALLGAPLFVVLAGLAKGHNRCPELDNANAVIQLSLARRKANVWWEYVASKANWADEPSRELEASQWLKEMGFDTRRAEVPEWPWTGQLDDIIQKAQWLLVCVWVCRASPLWGTPWAPAPR